MYYIFISHESSKKGIPSSWLFRCVRFVGHIAHTPCSPGLDGKAEICGPMLHLMPAVEPKRDAYPQLAEMRWLENHFALLSSCHALLSLFCREREVKSCHKQQHLFGFFFLFVRFRCVGDPEKLSYQLLTDGSDGASGGCKVPECDRSGSGEQLQVFCSRSLHFTATPLPLRFQRASRVFVCRRS